MVLVQENAINEAGHHRDHSNLDPSHRAVLVHHAHDLGADF
jgi:hypothetical protein